MTAEIGAGAGGGELVPQSVSLVRTDDETIEVVDERIGWLLRLTAIVDEAPPAPEVQSPAMLAALGALAERFPDLQQAIRNSSALQVVFSPELRKGLATGQYRLMQSGGDLVPTAVDATGKIVGTARVVPGTAAAAGGGVALGAAAAYSEQRWLERTFADLQRAVERLEHRLRDDDAGALEAADRLAALLGPSVTGGVVALQLKLELAAARRDVERIYLSRSRFVARVLRQLEDAQNEHERSTGESAAWVGAIADELRDRNSGLFDELVLFLQAMIVRGRITACTAAAVAGEGDGFSAVRLLDDLEPEIRHHYYDLYRRVRALGSHQPVTGRLGRVQRAVAERIPILPSGTPEDGPELMRWLDGQMESAVGESFADERAATEMTVPVAALRAS